jgi:hypothetical protein
MRLSALNRVTLAFAFVAPVADAKRLKKRPGNPEGLG